MILQRNGEKSYGNLVTVKPFEGDEIRSRIEIFTVYLDTLSNEENIRSIEKRGWRDKASNKNKFFLTTMTEINESSDRLDRQERLMEQQNN
jgi:hypothetical protein